MSTRETHLEGYALDKYAIVEFVAAGGFAEVYRAHDTMLNIDVVVKVLKPSQADSPSVARFREEAMRTANLHQPHHHPNIVEVFAVGESHGYYWLAMRLLHGQTLEARLRSGPLSLRETARILDGVAAALDHAHSRSLIHRDVKPSNIFLTDDNGVQLMDFGLVREVLNPGAAATKTIIGTPQYMSPEQIKGEAISARSDIYSLGLVAYEMLTGRAAFHHEAGNTWHVLNQQVNSDPPPMGLPGGASEPTEVEAAVRRAVSKQPRERWGSAGELAAAVATGLGERPAKYRAGVGTGRHVPGPVDRHRTANVRQVRATGASTTLIGMSAIGIVVLSWLVGQSMPSRRTANQIADDPISLTTLPVASMTLPVATNVPEATIIVRTAVPTALPTIAVPNTATAIPAPTIPAAPAAAAPAAFGFGVQVHAPRGDQRSIDAVKDLGFNWVKQQVEWHRYEGSEGAYEFGGLDTLVNQANAAGVNVLFSVAKAPGWARPGNTDYSVEGPPADPATFANFMGAMAAHFKGRVAAYEVWNEQNLHYEWGNEPIDPLRYVRMLCAVYGSIKAQDPGATVVSGAMAPTGVNNHLAMDDVQYLRGMYAANARGCFNALGAHPSGFNKPATAGVGWTAPGKTDFSGHRSFYFRGTIQAYRSVMCAYGDCRKKIWATEFGWATIENLGAGPAPGYGYAAQNSEGEQAQYLVDAFNLARSWRYVGPMFVNNLNRAAFSGTETPLAAFSIVRADWAPRPAYFALKGMSK